MNIVFRKDTWQEIYYSLRNNKLRTFLTMIGVGWGMFLYVTLLGAAKGMENGFNKLFSSFATKKIPEIDYIAPQNSKGNFGTAGVLMSRGGKSITYSLNGDYPIGNKISEKKLIYGRYLNDSDVSENKNVVVIGEQIYKTLFEAGENPIGKSINIKGVFFNVIGVFRMKRKVGIESDQTAIIPLSTFTQLFNEGDKVGVLSIVSKPDADVSIVEEKVKSELKTKYRVSPEDTNAFGAFNLGKEFKKLTGFLDGMQLLTIIVGTLTIIAGVIAISNILLITVKERTKEIGIRRALGAKPSEVRNQILLESVVITLSSGLAGFILGMLVLMLLSLATQNQDDIPFYNPTVNYGNVFGAMAIMVFLGLIIGMIPAQRAISIRPIDALRSE